MKNGAIFGFFGPIRFRGHFEEIAIAKVLLNTKPRGVGKFRWLAARNRLYPYTKFEVSSFTRSKDTVHVPLNGWIREGVCPNSRVDLRRFLPDTHQIWYQYSRMVNA